MKADSELVGYVLCEMLPQKLVRELCGRLGIRVPTSGTRHDQCRALAELIEFAPLHRYCVENWSRPDAGIHLRNLKSGLLDGFSWHNLAPSHLHLGLQGQVRRVANGESTIADFLRLGTDVIKKEYVMVAIADLTELTLVDRCGGTPPLKHRALSDVVLAGVPYDVKNTAANANWNAARIRSDPGQFAREMIAGADPERGRKQMESAYNPWAGNQLFVVTEDETLWLKDPESLLAKLAAQAGGLRAPHRIESEAGTTLAQVIVI